ncbi:YobH family protein [Rosenbergiella australiborealis]|uniref:Uncharacterized protein YobH n=1 Tax=Rosenbergiella australiborealis TaxID=1544696 RepID=A0ABS5T4E2_9GAMM|nr:YobH family protein [Rosenbergiella australiborealis]MBT0726287.1 hypothetical protein [Rosenbergiella australiborealis]
MLFTRLFMLVLSCWAIMMISDYGILTYREANNMGFNLRCEYLTGRGLINADYLFTSETAHKRCPLFKKNNDRLEM